MGLSGLPLSCTPSPSTALGSPRLGSLVLAELIMPLKPLNVFLSFHLISEFIPLLFNTWENNSKRRGRIFIECDDFDNTFGNVLCQLIQ